MGDWIVMSSVQVGKNNGTLYERNATGLSREAAEAEATARNAAEKAAGHKGIDWFTCEDPMAVLKRMGMEF